MTICIPIKDRLDLLLRCLDSLATTCQGESADVVIGDTGSGPETVEVCDAIGLQRVRVPGEFSFSRACNKMADAAKGERLLFLNSDTEAISTDWVGRLLSASQSEIDGAALVYPGTRRLQHAGVEVVRRSGWLQPSTYRPRGRRTASSGLALQNISLGKQLEAIGPAHAKVMAVSGAFLSTSRAKFLELGGFDEGFQTDLQDIDFCLRARARGFEVICHRDIVFSHKHAGTRGRYPFPLADWQLFCERWLPELERWERVGAVA